MAPEQLDLKPASARSDIFSLGVVCYEALTGRKPFQRESENECVEAIRTHMPPPISELNHSVNDQVSRAVQKAMAKQPYHRFSSAKEFAEILQRSMRNEHIEIFDRSRIQPRINRIKKALSDGDYQLATDMLDEVEAEGNLDPELSVLRLKTEQAARARSIYQLIESARTRMEEEEYPLALQNVQRVLDLDPANPDALSMKAEIERQRGAAHVGKWLQIARQHLDSGLFDKARQAVEEARKVNQSSETAQQLLQAITEGEQETEKLRREKQQFYEQAVQGYRNGDLSSALIKLQKVIELGKRAPGHPHTDAQYLALYEQIRSEHDELQNLYGEGKKSLESGDFSRALEICAGVLQKRPGETLFQVLKGEVESARRQQRSAAVAQLHSRIEAEPDLERKVLIVTQAAQQFPDEKLFSQSLQVLKDRRDQVNSIVARARQYESQRLFIEASNQWDVIRNIHPQYPGLDYELQRLAKKREEHGKEEAKAVWVDRIDRALFIRDYRRADEFLNSALAENPDDAELLQIRGRIREAWETNRRAHQLLEAGEKLANSGQLAEASQKLRAAREMDDSDPTLRAGVRSVLVEQARALVDTDWRAAQPLIEEALALDPADPKAVNVSRMVDDMRQREQIEAYLSEARDLQSSRKVAGALAKVEEGLRKYPNEIRLSQLRHTLLAATETVVANKAPKEEPPVIVIPARPVERTFERAEQRQGGIPLTAKIFAAVAAVLLIGALLLFRMKSGQTAAEQNTPVVAAQPAPVQPLPAAAVPDAAQRTKTLNVMDPRKVTVPEHATVSPEFTNFSLVSDPAGARAMVDGDPQLTCTTPCDFPLLKGVHKLTFAKPGFEIAQRSVRIPEDTSRTEVLAALRQTVRIMSDPEGASLVVDGEARGLTPKSLTLTTGVHKVVITKGDRSAEKEIEVSAEALAFTVQLDSGVPVATTPPQL
jgi:serine/threonine-protein kinase